MDKHCETCGYGPSKMSCGLAGAVESNEYIRENAVIVGCIHWFLKPKQAKQVNDPSSPPCPECGGKTEWRHVQGLGGRTPVCPKCGVEITGLGIFP